MCKIRPLKAQQNRNGMFSTKKYLNYNTKASLNWRGVCTGDFEDDDLTRVLETDIFDTGNCFDGYLAWLATQMNRECRGNVNWQFFSRETEKKRSF